MNKQHILSEIKRAIQANGGQPPGIHAFFRETRIKNHVWQKFWPRWGDAVREAGFEPNQMRTAYSDGVLFDKFIGLARELGRFPVKTEVNIKARSEDGFPGYSSFVRPFGSKQQFATKLLDYCKARNGYEDIIELCATIAKHQSQEPQSDESAIENAATTQQGYVYLALLKLGREKRYKIGKAVLVERRRDQISIQLPQDLVHVHTISTDDAYGIEDYWHRRFAAKNTKGEWFVLSREDVQAFRRRKFM